jgi:predicted nucleotidyltransferase component of viral defense system
MDKYTPRQYVEMFHLLFLAQLGRKVEKRCYALKGGCNMRFFFKSPRYSEDIDLDVQAITVDILRRKVNSILNSKPFRDILQVRDVDIEHITEHKQTATTQRWKLGLIVPQVGKPLPTRIEFSRRGMQESFIFESVNPDIIRKYNLSPFMANHYPAEITYQQKIKALISRQTAQARDIFDIFILLISGLTKVAIPKELHLNLARARENILSMDYALYKSQVISYLDPEDQSQYESEQVWDDIRLKVVESIRENES